MGAVFNTARVELGASVAVIGCGGVGLTVVQAAVLAGADRVIAADVDANKLAHATNLGATDIIDGTAGDPVDRVLELAAPGVDHAFEVVGKPETISQAFRMLRPGGAATIVGVVQAGVSVQLPAFPFLLGRTLRGSATGSNRFRIDIPRYVNLYLQGRLPLEHLIAEQRPFSEVNTALDALAGGVAARTTLMFR